MLCSSVAVDMVGSDVLVVDIIKVLRPRAQLHVIVRPLPNLKTTVMEGSGLVDERRVGGDGDEMRVCRELMSCCFHDVCRWRYNERNQGKELE
jgi:hypothetical protein